MKYVVKSGDTLYMIALRFGVTLDELIAANPQIQNPDVIQIGQEIFIPVYQMPGGTPVPMPSPYPELPIEQPPFIPSPGCMMPGMGYMMPDMGYMMPDMGYMMPHPDCNCNFIIQPGDKGCHVRCVQEKLKKMGYYNGACNGRFGTKTECAVKKYQSDCGMEGTGNVDMFMLIALGLL